MCWIKGKTFQMQKRNFSNKLEVIQLDFKKLKECRMVEKPPNYKKKRWR